MEGRAVRGQAILREGKEVSIELRATSRKLDEGHFAFILCRNITADPAIERERPIRSASPRSAPWPPAWRTRSTTRWPT